MVMESNNFYLNYLFLTKGKDFEVRVRESKTFTFTSVLFSKDEAIKMAGHLMDAEKMAALVEKRIRP